MPKDDRPVLIRGKEWTWMWEAQTIATCSSCGNSGQLIQDDEAGLCFDPDQSGSFWLWFASDQKHLSDGGAQYLCSDHMSEGLQRLLDERDENVPAV